MLRITSSPTAGGGTLLVLEGTLAGPWIEVLRSALATSVGLTELDLSAVGYVDAEGADFLRRAIGGRITIRKSSAFIDGLLGTHDEGGHS
jgi:hypothetical protein